MSRPPRELEDYWNQKLAESGFEDIEDTRRTDRPLIRWDSWKHPEVPTHERRKRNEAYQQLIDEFSHREDFEEICALVIKHGNARLTSIEVQMAWRCHCEGETERQIAAKLNRSKTGIHKILERLRAWMKLA